MSLWLKQHRDVKQLSQRQVAVAAKISQNHYSNIESGHRRPSPAVAHRIAAVLGFESEWYRLLED